MRTFRITVDGTAYQVSVEEIDAAEPAPVQVPRPAPSVAPRRAAAGETAAAPRAAASGPGDIASPLSGTVVGVEVAVGQQVGAGQPLLVLEAMKMNTHVSAPRAGTVSAIHVAVGAAVTEGQVLLSIS